jgi:NDP-sugar pyrophosphorylase family protein
MGQIPDVIVLVGGLGTRLAGVVPDRPKALASVAGQPFLDWLIQDLYRSGVRRLILSTGHLGDQIEARYHSGWIADLEVHVSREREPLGTAGALRHALPLVHSPTVFVTNGDTFSAPRLDELIGTHERNAARATLWTVHVDDCRRYGSIQVDRNGAVLAFREKPADPAPGVINAGTTLLARDLLEEIGPRRTVSLERDILPNLIGRGLYAVNGSGPFIDIGTPESYELAQTFVPLADSFVRRRCDDNRADALLRDTPSS